MESTSNALSEVIDDQICRGELLHKAAIGIARKVASDHGTDRLSPKQLYVYNKRVTPLLEATCGRCQCPIPMEELVDSFDNGGYCNWCDHMLQKDD